jgi:hypothetical protein
VKRLSILTQRGFQIRIEDCYSMARVCRMDSKAARAYLEKHVLFELARTTGKTKRPVYSVFMKGFVSGYCRALDNARYRDDLEFCYLKDGILYSTHKESIHKSTEEFYSSGRGCELGSLPSGHYWRFSDKPFFVRKENAE